MRFDYITNGVVKDISSIDSKQFHMNVLGCKNLTFENVTISAPEDSFNTDGIHIGRFSGINIIDSNIHTPATIVSPSAMAASKFISKEYSVGVAMASE